MKITHLSLLVAAGVLLTINLAHAQDIPEPKFEHQTLDKISIGYGLAIGDVDGDGKPDIVLADQKQFVWYRNPGAGSKDWAKHVIVENLTQRDNVCLAVRDINGDGKVEIAVGAQWNPGNTTDEKQSGSVHYLIRPDDPTKKWTPVKLPHEPTIHRMRWVPVGGGKFHLVVLPLHGRGNKGGQGAGVKVLAYEVPADPKGEWKTTVINDSMHMTHNLDVVELPGPGDEKIHGVIIAGKEGLRGVVANQGAWTPAPEGPVKFENPAGEVRVKFDPQPDGRQMIATIEPMHGNQVRIYHSGPGEDQPPV